MAAKRPYSETTLIPLVEAALKAISEQGGYNHTVRAVLAWDSNGYQYSGARPAIRYLSSPEVYAQGEQVSAMVVAWTLRLFLYSDYDPEKGEPQNTQEARFRFDVAQAVSSADWDSVTASRPRIAPTIDEEMPSQAVVDLEFSYQVDANDLSQAV